MSSKKTTPFLVSETLSERRTEMLALLGRRLFDYGVPTEVGVFLPVGVLRHVCIFFGMKKLHNTPKITADLGVSPPRSVFFRRSVI
jgi:hypothetical protein